MGNKKINTIAVEELYLKVMCKNTRFCRTQIHIYIHRFLTCNHVSTVELGSNLGIIFIKRQDIPLDRIISQAFSWYMLSLCIC